MTAQSGDTGRRGGVAGGVILIGIGMLAPTGWWWPGIMLVIGCGLAAERLLKGEVVQAMGPWRCSWPSPSASPCCST